METKEIDVRCPCCDSVLTVDVRTGKVLRHAAQPELDEHGKRVLRDSDWDAAVDRVSGRREEALDKFDSALSREKNRASDLDELFRKASESLREDDAGHDAGQDAGDDAGSGPPRVS